MRGLPLENPTCIEIDSDCRFALVARNLVDSKAREARKSYN